MRKELIFVVCLLLVTCTMTPSFAQLPAGWTSAGIGNPTVAGSAQYDKATDTWTIRGDGTGIRGSADQFHYVYKTLTGDGELATRVVSLDPLLADWSMAGVMIRVLLMPGSPSIFMGISANTDGQDHAITMWGREDMNGAADHESTGNVTPPCWVKVKRAGDTFSGYSSTNGRDWTERYTTSAPGIPQTIYIGYAVSSEVSGKLLTAVFDNGPMTATEPQPANGTKDMMAPVLRWTPGAGATAHDVYLGTTAELGSADYRGQLPAAAPVYFYASGWTPGATYYWRVDEIGADGKTIYRGDLWAFTAQALIAYLPEPADGATDASTTPTLLWQPGQVATKHHLFFGDDREAVAQGTAAVDKGTLTVTTFTPDSLESLTTYYWRVDEIVPDGTVRTGQVWSFMTSLPLDDFESVDQPIWEVWLDGWTNGTGSQVGYLTAPFSEQTIVHSGLQSLPLDYNNVNSPWYSEAEREWKTAQDWTLQDANALVLYIHGATTNTPAPLYVAVEDKAGHVGMVSHPDPALVTARQWTSWRIPLADFTSAGVNVTAVKKLYLGVGNRSQPAPGGAGRIYIDDIRLIKL
jgi:hypothetical protein